MLNWYIIVPLIMDFWVEDLYNAGGHVKNVMINLDVVQDLYNIITSFLEWNLILFTYPRFSFVYIFVYLSLFSPFFLSGYYFTILAFSK